MTVREMVREIASELRDGALTPDMARESLVKLTALLGNIGEEVRQADQAYKRVLLGYFEIEQKANRAKLKAETSDEYGRWREASDTEKLVQQMIISCRAYLRSLDEEARLAR